MVAVVRAARRWGADLLHVPYWAGPLCARIPTVVTIHDVSFLQHPETTEPRNLQYLTSKIRDTVRRADAIIMRIVS